MRGSLFVRGFATLICGALLSCSIIPSSAEEHAEVVKLRGGDLRLINNNEFQPKAVINGQEFPFAPQYIGHESTFRLSDRDVVVLSSDAGGSGTPPFYRIFSVRLNGTVEEITTLEFDTADGTLAGKQRGNVIYFDLGYDSGLKKDAVLSSEGLKVSTKSVARPAYGRKECKWLYGQALGECAKNPDDYHPCDDVFHSMSTVRGLYALEQNPRWNVAKDRFALACKKACETKKRPREAGFAKDICGS
jgi:hypothetical protein